MWSDVGALGANFFKVNNENFYLQPFAFDLSTFEHHVIVVTVLQCRAAGKTVQVVPVSKSSITKFRKDRFDWTIIRRLRGVINIIRRNALLAYYLVRSPSSKKKFKWAISENTRARETRMSIKTVSRHTSIFLFSSLHFERRKKPPKKRISETPPLRVISQKP